MRDVEVPALIGLAGASVTMLLSLVLLVVGVAVLRPASQTAGLALAAAGAARLFFTCLNDVALALASDFHVVPIDVSVYGGACAFFLDTVVFWGLVVFAAVAASREVQPR